MCVWDVSVETDVVNRPIDANIPKAKVILLKY